MPIIAHSVDGDNLKNKLISRALRKKTEAEYSDKDYPNAYHFNPDPTEIMKAAAVSTEIAYVDTVKRCIRLPDIGKLSLYVPRYLIDGVIVRILPDFITHFKQYPSFVIREELDKSRQVKDIETKDVRQEDVMGPNTITPCEVTRKNWRDWYDLNEAIFLSFLLELSQHAPSVSFMKNYPPEEMLDAFRAKKQTTWLEELGVLLSAQKIPLLCAPWSNYQPHGYVA